MFNPLNYSVTIGTHNGKNVIWLQFPNSLELRNQLKNVAAIHWSGSQKCWYTIDTPYHRKLFALEVDIIGKAVLTKIHAINRDAFQEYQNKIILKGFSQNTLRTYTMEFAQLLYKIQEVPVKNLTQQDIISYLLYCHTELKLSENQIHSRINAIKFYFEQVLNMPRMVFDIPRPKKPLLLPKALNQDEIKRIFDVTQNLKHKLILKLAYGMGLRVSEIVNLKIEHIDSYNMQVLIACAKGKKDRYVNLPSSVLEEMREYYKIYKPKTFLFEGLYNQQYSTRSAQAVFKTAMKKAHVNKTIGIHGLRHSYATHLLQQGTDIRYIKELMGHNDIKTTSIYTQVVDDTLMKIISPLDNL